MVNSLTIDKKTGCGTLHVIVCEGDDKVKPFISISLGKQGTCAWSQTYAIGKALTAALRCGVSIKDLGESLESVGCPQSLSATKGPESCADAISRILVRYAKEMEK